MNLNVSEREAHRKELPSPGRHLVRIITVRAHLHIFTEYTGVRGRLEMEILQGPE